jgi:hypothetical protein
LLRRCASLPYPFLVKVRTPLPCFHWRTLLPLPPRLLCPSLATWQPRRTDCFQRELLNGKIVLKKRYLNAVFIPSILSSCMIWMSSYVWLICVLFFSAINRRQLPEASTIHTNKWSFNKPEEDPRVYTSVDITGGGYRTSARTHASVFLPTGTSGHQRQKITSTTSGGVQLRRVNGVSSYVLC